MAEPAVHQRDAKEQPQRFVYVVASFAAINSVNLGYDIGVNSGVGVLLKDDDGGMELTDFELEAFYFCFGFAAILGALSAHTISDQLGRRRAFIISALGFIFGVLLTAFAPNFVWLLIGRFVTGIGVGFGLAIDPLYIAEVSPPEFRGQLVTWSETATNVGILLGFCSGMAFYSLPGSSSWRTMLGMGVILPTVLIYLALYHMPESPRWLIMKGRDDDAQKVLAKCYKEGTDIPALVASIKDSIREEQENSGEVTMTSLICEPTPATRRMLIVGVGVAVCQQTTAIEAIQYYALFILESSGVDNRGDEFALLVALGVVKVAVIVIAGRQFDSQGRRPLLLLSNLGMFVALMMLALNFSAVGDPSVAFAFIALVLFVSSFSFGMGPGCWLVASEVFSTKIRARAMSMATFVNRAIAVIVSSTYLSLKHALGVAGFFYLFAMLVMGNVLFIFTFMPETKGRTLEDMLRYFDEVAARPLNVPGKLSAAAVSFWRGCTSRGHGNNCRFPVPQSEAEAAENPLAINDSPLQGSTP